MNNDFIDLLEQQYDWPAQYPFKFIVPASKKPALLQIFKGHDAIEKPSSGGKYISCTFNILINSSNQIVDFYEQASHVEGVISL